MGLRTFMNIFYLNSKIYLSFQLLQFCVVLSLIIYFACDFSVNIQNPVAKVIELVLACVMILDISLIIYLESCRFNLVTILECFLILVYSVVIFLLEIHEIKNKSQLVEFYLLIFRVVFLVLRTGLIINNMYDQHKKKVKTTLFLSELGLNDLNDDVRETKLEA